MTHTVAVQRCWTAISITNSTKTTNWPIRQPQSLKPPKTVVKGVAKLIQDLKPGKAPGPDWQKQWLIPTKSRPASPWPSKDHSSVLVNLFHLKTQLNPFQMNYFSSITRSNYRVVGNSEISRTKKTANGRHLGWTKWIYDTFQQPISISSHQQLACAYKQQNNEQSQH